MGAKLNATLNGSFFSLKGDTYKTMNPSLAPNLFSQRLDNISIALYLAMFAGFILWFFSLIDILRNEFKKDINKLVWLFTIAIPILGPLLYLVIGFDQKIEKEIEIEDTDLPRRRR